jgi:hypothetical protein
MMTADQLLDDLGLAMNMPGLRFDASGCARLVFDGKTAVNFENESASGCVQLYCSLAPLPADGREALFQTLLQANLFGAKTQGATLAIDSQHHEIVLCRTLRTADATGTSFCDVVEKFVTAAEDWTRRLSTGSAAAQATTPSLPMDMGQFLRG